LAPIDWGLLSTQFAAPFVTARTVADLARSLAVSGEPVRWSVPGAVDKIGFGLVPGHHTTPIVTAIVSAAGVPMLHLGIPMPGHAVSGLAVMAAVSSVSLGRDRLTRVIEQEGACIAEAECAGVARAANNAIQAAESRHPPTWALWLAAMLSVRMAAGVSHVLVDVAVGTAAGLPDDLTWQAFRALCLEAGGLVGLHVHVSRSVGSQPVGRGIGPALAARDVLDVLHGAAAAPVDLRMHALLEAGRLLECAGASQAGRGEREAWRLLDNGAALSKFESLCRSQGDWREPDIAPRRATMFADCDGNVRLVDAAALSKLAAAAGAPASLVAGVALHVRVGDRVGRGQPLLTLHAPDSERLGRAQQALRNRAAIRVEPVP
jgi:thymidine phosphorylase